MRDASAVAGVPSARAGALTYLRTGTLALDVTLVGGLALVLGLIRLGAPSLWIDEAITARGVRDLPVVDIVDRQYHTLHYLVLKPWVALAGTSEVALRVPSVLGTVLSCALVVVLGRKLFDRRVALVAGVLLAVSPFVVKWSQQARGYTLGLAVALAATLLLLRALERGSRASWAIYGLSFSALVVWHPVVGVLLAPAHVVLVAQRRERVMPHGLLAGVIVLVLAVPWAAIVAMRSTGEGVAMNWLTFPNAETGVRALLDVSGAAGVGLALAIVGVGVLRRTDRSSLGFWLGTWALAPFVVSLLVSVVRPIYLDRYLMVASPAFALLGAVALTELPRRLRVVGATAVAVATGIGLVLWYASVADDGNWRGENWRAAVAAVLARQDEADAIVVAPWSSAPAAVYYGAEPADTSTAAAIWVLTWSETEDELRVSERRALGFGEHRLVERVPFGGRVNAELWRR